MKEKTYNAQVVVKYFYPVAAGIETNVLETYKRLAEDGWDITVHTSKDIHKEKNVLSDNDLIEGLKVKRYRMGLWGYWPKIEWGKTDFICLHNFDILPHFGIYVRVLIDKILGRKKYKLFITPHGGFNPEWKLYNIFKIALKMPMHFTFGTLVMNYIADGTRAVSEWERQRMMAWGVKEEKIKVISNGLEDQAFKTNIEKKVSDETCTFVNETKPYLVQIGRINRIKNFETAISALTKLDKINLVIIGPVQDKEYYAELIKLISKLKLEKRVKFFGVARSYDKYYLIKNAEAMVHMARWESFCNVVHEGMSQGIMCFVANNTALPFLIHDNENGFLINTNDFNELAKKIKLYLRNKNRKRYVKIIENNLNEVKKNSWRNTSMQMREFYISA